jgi:inosine-uridine nucleoside N-ribohydrolase
VNKVPLTRRFLDRLRAQSSIASQLAAQSWSLVEAQAAGGEYYFWDTVTAAVMLDPRMVTTENLKIRVLTGGASQGRTAEDPGGVPVEVALDASRDRVEQLFLDVLAR